LQKSPTKIRLFYKRVNGGSLLIVGSLRYQVSFAKKVLPKYGSFTKQGMEGATSTLPPHLKRGIV